MKKFLWLFVIFLFIGCTDLSNTPYKKVEDFFKKYQSLDKAVITDLNNVVNEKTELTDSQKEVYKDIMKKHYQNLSYDIKDETINGNDAVVTVEIEVTDFKKVIDEAQNYLSNNVQKFYNGSNVYDINLYNDYLLSKMKEAKDTVKYTLYISLTKKDEKWELNTISDSIYEKINGIYNY